MDYKKFVYRYFKGERVREIERNVTPDKYSQLFGQLSEKQMEIISDKESRCIVVAAGPGSGKTRVLVHKLASLLLLEDVKHEQLLMLTFSRAAAIEFKQRLMGLIGNAAHFVEIKTFHSYCFDLLGRVGNLDDSKDVVARAAKMIHDGEVEPNRIAKTVLVIDEAQDMSDEEYALVRALMTKNEEMRVIAVGDDDQNIFEFRGSNSRYMRQLLMDSEGRFIEMTENYRSSRHVVGFANAFVTGIKERMKNTPIVSMRKEEGLVSIWHHSSGMMYQPLVDDLLKHRGDGSVSILTQTNEEAVILVALLRKYGVQSKLIQSMDGLRFWNMAEVRMFLKLICQKTTTPMIASEVWEEAKNKTYSIYSDSASLHYLQRCIELFEQTNKAKYLTDFKECVFESSVEDFCDVSGTDVVISTIHKSKGREFDDVYMLIAEPSVSMTMSQNGDGSAIRPLGQISKPSPFRDEVMRRYYVGATRAKHRLFIHTNGSIFDRIPADEHLVDQRQYDMPDEIVLQMTHKDVHLGFFKDRKETILGLRAGGELLFDGCYFHIPSTNRVVAKLSQKMQEELANWYNKGYYVSSSVIRFVVAWKAKDAPKEEKEYAVLLIDLELKSGSRNLSL